MGNTCVTMHSLHLGGQEYFDEIKLLYISKFDMLPTYC